MEHLDYFFKFLYAKIAKFHILFSNFVGGYFIDKEICHIVIFSAYLLAFYLFYLLCVSGKVFHKFAKIYLSYASIVGLYIICVYKGEIIINVICAIISLIIFVRFSRSFSSFLLQYETAKAIKKAYEIYGYKNESNSNAKKKIKWKR